MMHGLFSILISSIAYVGTRPMKAGTNDGKAVLPAALRALLLVASYLYRLHHLIMSVESLVGRM